MSEVAASTESSTPVAAEATQVPVATAVATEAKPKPAKKVAKKAAPVKKVAAKKSPKKKAATKKAAKSVKKPKAAKKAAKGTSTPRAKKEGLRKPQVRILKALSKSNRGLSRAEISEKAKVDLAMLNSYIGSLDEGTRKKNDANVCVSLLTLGYVKAAAPESEGRASYYAISASGKAALAKAEKE